MTTLKLHLGGEGAWPDLVNPGKDIVEVDGGCLEIATLPDGTRRGKPSIALRIDLPDGKVVIVETTAVLFLAAADAVRTWCSNVGS